MSDCPLTSERMLEACSIVQNDEPMYAFQLRFPSHSNAQAKMTPRTRALTESLPESVKAETPELM